MKYSSTNQSRRLFLRMAGWASAGMFCGPTVIRASTVKRSLGAPSLDFATSVMPVKRRTEWTDREVRPWRLRASNGVFDRITIHHAGNGILAETNENAVIHLLDGVLTAHMDRNYGDVGYHFVVDYAGRAWEGRSLAYEGAHVSRQNERNIGIMLLGNFDKQKPSEKQLATCEKLVQVLRSEYLVKRHRIYGHRDLGQSACPGHNLYSHVLGWRGTKGS